MGESLFRGNLMITDRKRIEIDNVKYIRAFDESYVSLDTGLGRLTVEGKELKIEELCKESGKVRVLGEIDALYFSSTGKKGWRGLFR